MTGGGESVRRDDDVVAVGRVELEGRKVVVRWRGVVAGERNQSTVVGMVTCVLAHDECRYICLYFDQTN